MEQTKEATILDFKVDMYKAATLNAGSFHSTDTEEFNKVLLNTMKHLHEIRARGVWLKLNLEQSLFIPAAVKYGFEFHHALDDYLLLSYWIPKDQPNKLPHYATHFIGVGGVVFNEETEEILAVQERISVVENYDFWKIPGGLVESGEYISQGVEREIFEETGIKAKFISVLAFREKLVYKWGQPDIFFMCLLKPETFEINHDVGEIKTAKWMKLDEYLEHSSLIPNPFSKIIELKKVKGIDKLKSLKEETLLGLTGYIGENFALKLGNYESSDNIFYTSKIARKALEVTPSL